MSGALLREKEAAEPDDRKGGCLRNTCLRARPRQTSHPVWRREMQVK